MVSTGGVAADQLRTVIERIERLKEEKAALAADVREIFAEAKGNGFDTKAIRQILKLRRMDASERQEQEEMLNLYKTALGMQPSLFDDEPEEDTKVTISTASRSVTLTGSQLKQAADGIR